MPEYKNMLEKVVEWSGAEMPEGFDSWGIKSTRPDLTTWGGYQWPFPGSTAKATPESILMGNTDACPLQPGDGLCVALTWRGMASGGFPARTLLLVAYKKAEVLGEDVPQGKLRTRSVRVVRLLDGEAVVRALGSGANLSGADLRYATLRSADLRGADLSNANLHGAYLYGAHLYGADLRHAVLYGADLRGADLSRANLRDADLSNANLYGAHLRHADLSGAYLRGANLGSADLRGADLSNANLSNAGVNRYTAVSSDVDLDSRGVIRVP